DYSRPPQARRVHPRDGHLAPGPRKEPAHRDVLAARRERARSVGDSASHCAHGFAQRIIVADHAPPVVGYAGFEENLLADRHRAAPYEAIVPGAEYARRYRVPHGAQKGPEIH